MKALTGVMSVVGVAGLLGCSQGPAGPAGPPGPPGAPAELRGKAVELSAQTGATYRVVAAGRVQFNTVAPPALNGLRVVDFAPSQGRVLVSYEGYQPPSPTRRLIVKAIAGGFNENGGPFYVHVDSAGPQGIVLLVTRRNGQTVAPDATHIDIEVSELSVEG